MRKEIWEPIEGYEGLYEVSNLGQVRRVERTKVWYTKKSMNPKNMHFREMILHPQLCPYDYSSYKVQLTKDGKILGRMIHVLVAKAFVPNPHKYRWIKHIDGDRLNNRAENLQWVKSLK